jgi:mRNA-degrading endonuclease RelE of RelBE toxin-antitoxin system
MLKEAKLNIDYLTVIAGENDNYRYIVCGNYKIIYSVDIEEQLIKIADVFDTRQNPIKIKRNK